MSSGEKKEPSASQKKAELKTWMPNCPITFEPAICELIPCGHFISLSSARKFGQYIRSHNRASNPDKCPMCRQQWREIRCLSVEKTHEKIRQKLVENTADIPNGPLRIWFQQILHFFTSYDVIQEDLKTSIGKCLVDNFVQRTDTSGSGGSGGNRLFRFYNYSGGTIVLTNNQAKIIQLIECVKTVISDYIRDNFVSKDKAISEMTTGVMDPESYKGSPIQWILEESEAIANGAIEQARSINLPERNSVINTETMFSRIRRSLGTVATEAPRQIPTEMATIVLSTAALIGTAQMYRAVDYSVCDGLDTTPIPGPDVPTRGRWGNFPVCTSRYDQQYCCDPKGSTTGSGACGTDSYHTGDGSNVYSGPDIDYSQKSAMEPGGEYNCDRPGNGLLPECIANSAFNAFACTITGDEECDVPGGYGWARADGATFEVTETGPRAPIYHLDRRNVQMI